MYLEWLFIQLIFAIQFAVHFSLLHFGLIEINIENNIENCEYIRRDCAQS